LKARRASLRSLRHPQGQERIDRALLLSFPAPNSYTGEDCAECHIHGGRAVLDALFEALNSFPSTRLAEPGEFTRRAFLNGRMDLTEAEGVADLIAAETAAQRRSALDQADGALSRLYDGWRDRLLRQLAHIEAWLDFPDEDLPASVMRDIGEQIRSLSDEITGHLNESRRGERLRDGVTIALVGAPNAGKSTLLNALARRDVAIVSETPGTTRDLIEVAMDLGGYPVIVIDTAGLRDSGDTVEMEGIRRARERAGQADIVLHLSSACPTEQSTHPEPFSGTLEQLVLHITTKTDLLWSGMSDAITGHADLRVSAATGDGLDLLLKRLSQLAADLADQRGNPLPTRVRHVSGLKDALQHLAQANEFGDADPPELMAEELRLAMTALARITGSVDVEDLLDVIFRDFCIGK